MHKTTVPILVALICQVAFPQDLLTLDQAIDRALQKNFYIQLEKNKADIAAVNNSPGNAGMLPKASAGITGAGSLSSTATNVAPPYTYGDTEVSVNPSVTVSWTLFDGLKMFATKARLRRLEDIAGLNYKDTLQTIVAQVITSYYDIVSATQQLQGLQKSLAVASEREKITEKQFQVGTASEVDLLQAKVDMNEEKSAILAQEDLITQKKTDFNTLLARAPDLDFRTADSIPIDYQPRVLSSAELESKNFQLIAATKNVDVARYSRREALSVFFPTVNITGGYDYSWLQNNTDERNVASQTNTGTGLNAGITLSVPLFNGFNNVHGVQLADLNILNSQIALDNLRRQIESQHYQARHNFERAQIALKLEEENIQLADKNLTIALELFRVGQSTAVDMRTAELSYEQAVTRLVTARFNAKSAETELMRIQDELVK